MPMNDESDFRLGLLTPPPPASVRQPDIEHTAPDPIYDTYQRILPMGASEFRLEFLFFSPCHFGFRRLIASKLAQINELCFGSQDVSHMRLLSQPVILKWIHT